MNKIAGFYSLEQDLSEKKSDSENLLKKMKEAQEPSRRKKGMLCSRENEAAQKEESEYLNSRFGLIRTGRLSVRPKDGADACVLYSGEIYNWKELCKELSDWGFPEPKDEADALLAAYLAWGPDFIKKVNGCFSIAVADEKENRLLLYRDRAGTRPLFYTVNPEKLLCFSSSLKALLACQGIRPQADLGSLNEIFSIGPARTPGCGVYKNISEVLPGCFLCASPAGIQLHDYWKLRRSPTQTPTRRQ